MFTENVNYMVHAYKYNGWLYRTVEYPYLIYKNKHVVCLYLPEKKISIIKGKEDKRDVNDQAQNRKIQKRFKHFQNSNSMLWFFFKNKWFNVIANLKENTVCFYINLASPYLIEENAIKYIDFDLDIKINSKNEYKIVDQHEWKENLSKWRYPWQIIKKIENSKEEIINLIQKNWFKNLLSKEEIKSLKQVIKEKFGDYQIELKFDEENMDNEKNIEIPENINPMD